MDPIVRLERISKVFPGVKALSDINVSFLPGEVHALVGENGAGKSTLIKIILGAYTPTEGTIFFQGKERPILTPKDASGLGIEGVHQELMLIPWISVAQNIFLNREIRNPVTRLFEKRKMEEISAKLLIDFGINIDVSRPAKAFSASVWKMVDIARVINLNPKVIIFDEPTAILTEREVDALFKKILELKNSGIAIIYISHRLKEINKIADRITILRDGHLIKTAGMNELTEDDIVKCMVGRDVSNYYSRNIAPKGDELVRFDRATLKKGQRNISITVCRGEIVGLAGLVGSGRTEVGEAIMGMNRIISGDFYYKGEKIHPQSPKEMIGKGMYLVPENRKYEGLILRFSVAENLGLSVFKKWSKFFFNKKKEAEVSDRLIQVLSIKTPSRKQLVKNLSGGNQQKVVIGKALETESDFLIFDEPSVGVDVGAKEEIHNLMDQIVNRGNGILMISSDLPEVIGMSDRVYIMYEGEIVKELDRSELSDKNIADYMLGSKKQEGSNG